MMKRIAASIGASMLIVGAVAMAPHRRNGSATASATGHPVPRSTLRLFVSVIDNPYYPLPVGSDAGVPGHEGRADAGGSRPGHRQDQGDRRRHGHGRARRGSPRSEGPRGDQDWFAQDVDGNVCYLGEDTKHFGPNGQVDTSGSWEAGVDGAVSGIIMLADPQVPDAYRQEYYVGQAEDTAWITNVSGSISVPYGTVHDVVTSLEHSVLEPDVIDQKVYAPGLGIVLERAIAGDVECRPVGAGDRLSGGAGRVSR